jgi:cytochrome c-type biogenesis protein CcmH/NrfG
VNGDSPPGGGGETPTFELGSADAARPAHTAERIGLLTLLCVVVAFGVHSAIDWTWFVPGVTAPALLCAGWLAGRGRPDAPVGRRGAAVTRPATVLACSALVAVTLLAAWAIWQPLRSSDAAGAVLTDVTRGDTRAAFADARAAAARDPVSVQPLWLLSELYSRIGDRHAAHDELVKAISLQPENPATWLQLGLYNLQYGQPHKALGVLEKAQQLDRSSRQTAQAIAQARTQLQALAPKPAGRARP